MEQELNNSEVVANPIEESKFESVRQNTNASLIDQQLEDIVFDDDNIRTGRQNTIRTYYGEESKNLGVERMHQEYYDSNWYTPTNVQKYSLFKDKDSENETAFKFDSNVKIGTMDKALDNKNNILSRAHTRIEKKSILRPLNTQSPNDNEYPNFIESPSPLIKKEFMMPTAIEKVNSISNQRYWTSEKLITIEENNRLDGNEKELVEEADNKIAENQDLIADMDSEPNLLNLSPSPSKKQKLRKLRSRKLRRRIKAGKSKQASNFMTLGNSKYSFSSLHITTPNAKKSLSKDRRSKDKPKASSPANF